MKTEKMTIKRKEPISTKIVLDNKITGQISRFKYLVCDAPFNKNKDFDNKLYKFQ